MVILIPVKIIGLVLVGVTRLIYGVLRSSKKGGGMSTGASKRRDGETDQSTNFFSSDLVKKYAFLALGMMIYLVGAVASDFLSTPSQAEKNAVWTIIVSKFFFSLQFVGGSLVAIAGFALLSKPLLSPLIRGVIGGTRLPNEVLEDVCTELKSRLPSAEILRTSCIMVESCEKRQREIIQLVDKKISDITPLVVEHHAVYGKHSSGLDSFYSFMDKCYLRPYCVAPHMSDLRLSINVKQLPQNSNFFEWREINEYLIHAPEFERASSNTFPLLLGFQALLNEKNVDVWMQGLDFKILISDNKNGTDPKEIEIVDRKIIENEEDVVHDGVLYVLQNSNESVRIRYKNDLMLKQEYTWIKTTETSLLDKNDTFLSYAAQSPICKMSVNFDIPHGWCFEDAFECYFDDIYRFMPKKFKEQFSKEQFISGGKTSPHNFSIRLGGWIPPGIAFSVRWRKDDLL